VVKQPLVINAALTYGRAVRAAACLLVILNAACTATPFAPPPSSPPPTAAAASSTPTVGASSTTGGTRRPSISVKTTPVAAIPKDFVYVESSPGVDVTLWLVDLSRATPPVAVARWTGGNGTLCGGRRANRSGRFPQSDRQWRHLLDPKTVAPRISTEAPRNVGGWRCVSIVATLKLVALRLLRG